MKKIREVTIYDIAKKLNIAASTVSRGLQDSPQIGIKTKKKIFDTAAKMGYHVNHYARRLRQQQSNAIGVIVHRLNSNFVASVLSGIESVTTKAGYDLLIANSSENFGQEAANAKSLFHRRVDGLIVSLSFETSHLEHFKPFIEKGIPVLFFDRVEQDEHSTIVIIDNNKCGYIATSHLIEQGCKHIVHVTSGLNRNVYDERYKGYRKALADHKLPFRESMLIVGDLSEQAGIDAAMQMIQMNPRPDGAFITSDFLASICIRTLKENGITVPDDIAIVGFNNDPIGKIVEPTLTTINYPGEDMGKIAANNLIDHLNGISNINETNTIIVHSELIVRNSSLKKGRPID